MLPYVSTVVLCLVLHTSLGVRPELQGLHAEDLLNSAHTLRPDKKSAGPWLKPVAEAQEAQDSDGFASGLSLTDQEGTSARAAACEEAVLLHTLRSLGIRGDGPPCSWPGIRCEDGCVTRIALSKSQATGNIIALQNLTTLRYLDLQQTQVAGDLRAFSALTQLQGLDLKQTHFGGDLRALSPLTQLRALNLQQTQVAGDLRALSPLTLLWSLKLRQTQVAGDVRALSPLTQLQAIYLQQTQVAGDLQALSPLTQLQYLELQQTQVAGDLRALSNLTEVSELLLGQSNVHGHLSGLREMRKLKVLNLAGLQEVEGELGLLRGWPALEKVDLSETGITSFISYAHWRPYCKELREMKLAGSRVGGLQPVESLDLFTTNRLLPSLQILDVSNCALNASVAELLLPLAATPITSLSAAGCGLHGELPTLNALAVRVDGSHWTTWPSTLGEALQVLDLSKNSIARLRSPPSALRILSLGHNAIPMTIDKVALAEAVRSRLDLMNLQGTELANRSREEVRQLLGKELETSQSRPFANAAGGYACAELTLASLKVTPDLFLPDQMCVCLRGYAGRGTACKACPADTFTDREGQPQCEECPANSIAPKTSASCECKFGQLRGPEGNRSCQCDPKTALLKDHCSPCSKLHLQCPQNGSIAEVADPEPRYVRLPGAPRATVFACLDPLRCPGKGHCAAGYSGPLCTACAPTYRSTGGQCAKCLDLGTEATDFLKAAAVASLLLALLGTAAYMSRSYVPRPSLVALCAGRLLLPEGLVLLQLAQLWAASGRLAKQAQGAWQEAPQEVPAEAEGDPMMAYVEAFQLTGTQLVSFVDLQCRFDGELVRTLTALATPVLPILVLFSCSCLEICSFGTGVSMALNVLTVLFVGGASGAVQLLGCQDQDGEGREIPKESAFRTLFPHLLCTDSTGMAAWVDRIGLGSGTIYGMVIPLFLAFLFIKQNVTTRQSKTFIASASRGKTNNEVRLNISFCDESKRLEDEILEKRLLSAAAAHLAVSVRGRAAIELCSDAMIVIPMQENSGAESEFPAESIIMDIDKKEADVLRRNALMQMLTERSILEEVQSDRVIVGAKKLLSKYASCNNVWMEVALKLASAVLVSVVATEDGMWLSVAVTLGMALIIGVARPFALPQVNTLQSFSFLCLAVASVGFARRDRLLPRLALAAPVLLAAFQLLRPDSTEALALRLQQDLEQKLPALRRGERVEVKAEELRLL